MNSLPPLQTDYYKDFVPPKGKSIFSPRFLVFWGFNILTLGIFSGGEILSKRYRIKKLNPIRHDLEMQAAKLVHQWNILESELADVLDQVRVASGSDKEHLEKLRDRVGKLSVDKDHLEEKNFHVKTRFPRGISDFIIGIIVFVGHMLANTLFLGLYGTYCNHRLRNRVMALEAKNAYFTNYFENQKEIKLSNLQKVIDLSFDYFKLKEKCNKLESSVQAQEKSSKKQAILEEKQSQLDITTLKNKNQSLQDELMALKKEKLLVEKEVNLKSQEIKQFTQQIAYMKDEETKLKKLQEVLQKYLEKNEKELKNLEKTKKKEINDLNGKIKQAVTKVSQAKDEEIALLKSQIHTSQLKKASTQSLTDMNPFDLTIPTPKALDDPQTPVEELQNFGMDVLNTPHPNGAAQPDIISPKSVNASAKSATIQSAPNSVKANNNYPMVPGDAKPKSGGGLYDAIKGLFY